MTKPQDKMRAEFEATMRAEPHCWMNRDFHKSKTAGQTYADFCVEVAWKTWQAACAQQYAQSQQDALDVARWLVFNIGCIECGVSSNVVGRFSTEDEAKTIAATCEASLGWREGGQNSFEVFDLNAPQASEYTVAIAAQGASNV